MTAGFEDHDGVKILAVSCVLEVGRVAQLPSLDTASFTKAGFKNHDGVKILAVSCVLEVGEAIPVDTALPNPFTWSSWGTPSIM